MDDGVGYRERIEYENENESAGANENDWVMQKVVMERKCEGE